MDVLSLTCKTCFAPLASEDGHLECPSCLGTAHLRSALTNPCPSCAVLPLTVREARLTELLAKSDALLSTTEHIAAGAHKAVKRGSTGLQAAQPAKKKAKSHSTSVLNKRVDDLSSAVSRIETLLLQFQPPQANMQTMPPAGGTLATAPTLPTREEPDVEDDTLSTAATDSLFNPVEDDSLELPGSPRSGISSDDAPSSVFSDKNGDGRTLGPQSLLAAITAALVQRGLQPLQSNAGVSAYFRQPSVDASSIIPKCDAFVDEFQTAFKTAAARSHPTSVARAMSNMADAGLFGLDTMPAVDPCVASLVVSPDEAVRPQVRCPSKACRRTDDDLVRAYNHAARIGRIDNTISHLLLAAQSSLLKADSDPAVREAIEATLQGVGFMTQELGRLMAVLVRARRQVWLSQTPLPDACRATLRELPLIPGQLFGPAAKDALERRALVSETRKQQVGLSQVTRFRAPQPPALRREFSSPQRAAPQRQRENRHAPRGSAPFRRQAYPMPRSTPTNSGAKPNRTPR